MSLRTPRLTAQIAAALLASASLSACVPKLDPAPVPKPPSAYATEQTFAAPAGEWPSDRWWTAYGDPQLTALIDEALADAPNLRVAESRVRAAVAQSETQRAVGLPQVTGDASSQESRSSLNEGFPPQFFSFLPHSFKAQSRVTVDLDWQLDFFGRNRAALAAATSQAEAARADRAAARLQLSTAVAAAYADLVRLYADRDTAVQSVGIRRQSLSLVGQRLRNGLETQGQFSQQNATVPASQQEVEAIDAQIVLTRHQLAALLGKGPDRGLAIARPSNPNLRAFGLPAHLAADLIGRRPDIVAARLRAQAAASQVKAARADFYPNVDLTGAFGVQSLGINYLFQANSISGALGPAIRLPLFSGGRIEGAYRGARAQYDEAVANYDQTLTQALRDVADAIASQRSVQAQLAQARASLTASEDAYRVARLRYTGGLSPYLDVLTAENTLLAERRTVSDLASQSLALDVSLIRALGGGYVAG